MRDVWIRAALITCLFAAAPLAAATFDLRGNLQLVDLPAAASPVEAMLVTLRSLDGGLNVQAAPDRDGNFVLKGLRPGRYALVLPVPGRIVRFTQGSEELSPTAFRGAAGGGALRIVVSLKSSDLRVKVLGVPSKSSDVVALLAPADPRLTLQSSYYSLGVRGSETEVRHVPPGRYRIFIIPAAEQSRVSAYAPRFGNFLKQQATTAEVLQQGEARATAAYIDAPTIEGAIRRVGPLR